MSCAVIIWAKSRQRISSYPAEAVTVSVFTVRIPVTFHPMTNQSERFQLLSCVKYLNKLKIFFSCRSSSCYGFCITVVDITREYLIQNGLKMSFPKGTVESIINLCLYCLLNIILNLHGEHCYAKIVCCIKSSVLAEKTWREYFLLNIKILKIKLLIFLGKYSIQILK